MGTELIPAKELSRWVTKAPASYLGSYHFGESECESTLTLHLQKGVLTATKEHTATTAAHMRVVGQRLTHVQIVGTHFYSDQATEEFVTLAEGPSHSLGLKLHKSWSCNQPKGTAEVGIRL